MSDFLPEACPIAPLRPIAQAVTFRVAGHPVTQGSKRAFVRAGRAVVVEAGGLRHKDWRHAVNDEARRAWEGQAPMVGPVYALVTFALQAPKSKPKGRRTWPIAARSGDIDKLARCVLDSLTGVVFTDDSQVVYLIAHKDWAGELGPGVTITIRAIPEMVKRHQERR